jgi:hypothetical protein
MGLKGYRLWVVGQLDSTCSASPGEVRLVLLPETSSIHATNLTPGSDNENTVQLMTAVMVHVTN